MKKHLAERALGADLTWLCTPLLAYYCEVVAQADAVGIAKIPELEELRSLTAQAPAYLGIDDRSWSCAAAVAAVAPVCHRLALELVSAMKQFDATQINTEVFQPIIDAVCGDAAQVTEDTTRGKKRVKEELDIIKYMNEVGVTPSPTQAQRLLHWYQDTRRFTQATQVLQDLIANAPKTQQLASVITTFLVNCAEHKEGIHVMSVVKRMEGTQVELTREQYVQVIRSLLAHKLQVVALDVLRWMNTHARDAFVPVREELLKDAPDTPWARTLQKMS